MININIFFWVMTFFLTSSTYSQKITLEQAYKLAIVHSKLSKLISTNNEQKVINKEINRYINYPSANLNFNLPNFNKSISELVLPNGSKTLVEQNAASGYLGLSISQKVPFTSGRIAIDNSISRLDQFGVNRSTNYSASWLNISYSQPFITFNEHRFTRLIQDMENKLFDQESIKNYFELKRDIANIFFDIGILQKKIHSLNDSKKIYDSIKSFILLRLKEKNITSLDTLEINMQISQCEFEIDNLMALLPTKLKYFKTLLGVDNIGREYSFEFLEDRSELLNYEFDNLLVSNKAENIRKYKDSIEVLNAIKALKKADIQRYPDIKLNANYGNNNSAGALNSIFANPSTRMAFNIGFSYPILNWGQGAKSAQLARLALKEQSIKSEIEKDKLINGINELLAKHFSCKNEIKVLKKQLENIESQLKLYGVLFAHREVLFESVNRIILKRNEIKLSYLNRFKDLSMISLELQYIFAH